MFGTASQYKVDYTTKNFAYDIVKTKRELSFEPKNGLREGIEKPSTGIKKTGISNLIFEKN